MLFEQRSYTLKPGCVEDFWQAQRDRGYELMRPILERQVGYFATLSGPADHVVHLYRYDSYEDWKQRLHGLYGVAALQPYFSKARALMLAQENCFLTPAPAPELNPLWSQGRDWLPEQGPLFQRAKAPAPTLVEQQITVLRPGAMALYWQEWSRHSEQVLCDDASRVIGCFTSVVGRQHQIVLYRVHESLEQGCSAAASPALRAFLQTVAPLVASRESHWLTPALDAPLAPLFF